MKENSIPQVYSETLLIICARLYIQICHLIICGKLEEAKSYSKILEVVMPEGRGEAVSQLDLVIRALNQMKEEHHLKPEEDFW